MAKKTGMSTQAELRAQLLALDDLGVWNLFNTQEPKTRLGRDEKEVVSKLRERIRSATVDELINIAAKKRTGDAGPPWENQQKPTIHSVTGMAPLDELLKGTYNEPTTDDLRARVGPPIHAYTRDVMDYYKARPQITDREGGIVPIFNAASNILAIPGAMVLGSGGEIKAGAKRLLHDDAGDMALDAWQAVAGKPKAPDWKDARDVRKQREAKSKQARSLAPIVKPVDDSAETARQREIAGASQKAATQATAAPVAPRRVTLEDLYRRTPEKGQGFLVMDGKASFIRPGDNGEYVQEDFDITRPAARPSARTRPAQRSWDDFTPQSFSMEDLLVDAAKEAAASNPNAAAITAKAAAEAGANKVLRMQDEHANASDPRRRVNEMFYNFVTSYNDAVAAEDAVKAADAYGRDLEAAFRKGEISREQRDVGFNAAFGQLSPIAEAGGGMNLKASGALRQLTKYGEVIIEQPRQRAAIDPLDAARIEKARAETAKIGQEIQANAANAGMKRLGDAVEVATDAANLEKAKREARGAAAKDAAAERAAIVAENEKLRIGINRYRSLAEDRIMGGTNQEKWRELLANNPEMAADYNRMVATLAENEDRLSAIGDGGLGPDGRQGPVMFGQFGSDDVALLPGSDLPGRGR